jgi:hypothetical protein
MTSAPGEVWGNRYPHRLECMADQEEWCSINEAARRLGVTPRHRRVAGVERRSRRRADPVSMIGIQGRNDLSKECQSSARPARYRAMIWHRALREEELKESSTNLNISRVLLFNAAPEPHVDAQSRKSISHALHSACRLQQAGAAAPGRPHRPRGRRRGCPGPAAHTPALPS